MKSDGIKKNFIFQLLYQIIVLVLPLVTAPYLTRILGDSNLGIYAYTYSIAYYFVVFANLGIARHGQRILAARKNDETKLRKTFWSLLVLHVISSIMSVTAYLIFCILQPNDKAIFLIQGIFVASALFELTWLFYGLESFKSVVVTNGLVRIIETILIFVFVKTSDDLVLYTFIMAVATLLNYCALLPKAIKSVKPISFGLEEIKEHIKPLLVLSITIIAVSLYTVFDKTLLGLMTTKENVAYYEYADKIIKIPRTIIGVIGTVMFPRSCACFAKEDYEGLKKYVSISIEFAFFIGFGAIAGLFEVGDLFAVVYYGADFATTGTILKWMAPVIVVVAVGDIIRTQLLIPSHKDFAYTICVLLTAVLNIVLTIILIPNVGVIGAVIGTLSAEFVGLVIQSILCRSYINWIKITCSSLPYLVSAVAMVLSIELVKRYYNSTLPHLLLQVGVGAVIYCSLLLIWHFLISPNKKQNISVIRGFIHRKGKNDV